MITLKSNNIEAVISPKGAELQSLKNINTGIEYMWSGDAVFWGKHSPVLFPVVGTLKNDTYIYNGKSYSLPRHGFAREKTFAAEQLSDDEAIFTLEHSEETLAVYPFHFRLILRYRLHENALTCTYEVHNPGYEPLLFSVGAHPAFAVPMVPGTDYTDYYLQFNKTEPLNRWKLEDGLIAAHAEPLPTDDGKIQLHHSLFAEDAIVLKNLASDTITLGSSSHGYGLHFHFKDFPFFGIWAAKQAPFVCLEPWCGIADSVNHNQQFVQKEGIITLAPHADWKRSWSVEVF